MSSSVHVTVKNFRSLIAIGIYVKYLKKGDFKDVYLSHFFQKSFDKLIVFS